MSDAEQDPEHRIRDRAYHLWRDAGSPEGRSDEFWHQARDLEEKLQRDQGTVAPSETGAPSEKESGRSALESVTDAMTEGNVPPHRGVP
jgi:hypothetical protein